MCTLVLALVGCAEQTAAEPAQPGESSTERMQRGEQMKAHLLETLRAHPDFQSLSAGARRAVENVALNDPDDGLLATLYRYASRELRDTVLEQIVAHADLLPEPIRAWITTLHGFPEIDTAGMAHYRPTADPDQADYALFNAVRVGNRALVRVLAERGAPATVYRYAPDGTEHVSVVREVVAVQDTEMLELLLELDVEHNSAHYPLTGGSGNESDLLYAVRERLADSLRVLLVHGEDPNQPFQLHDFWSYRLTRPLHAAVRANAPEIIRLLLEFGADVNGPELLVSEEDGHESPDYAAYVRVATPLDAAQHERVRGLIVRAGGLSSREIPTYEPERIDDLRLCPLYALRGPLAVRDVPGGVATDRWIEPGTTVHIIDTLRTEPEVHFWYYVILPNGETG